MSQVRINEELLDEIKASLEEARKAVCHSYSMVLNNMANKEDEEDSIEYKVFRCLSMATSFTFNPESSKEPFSRSAIPEDFDEEQLDLIEEVIQKNEDPELNARLSDLIWIRRRDFEHAKCAIENYLATAERLQDNELQYYIDRLERALRMSHRLGKGGADLFNDVVDKIEEQVSVIKSDNAFSIIRLVELLLEFKAGEASHYTTFTEELAEKAEKQEDWRRARNFWELNSKWNEKLDKSEIKRESLIKAAETYVKEAEAATSNLISASCLQQAIEAHRRIGNQQERTSELHKRLLDVQSGIEDEMGSFSTDIDITDAVEYARSNVEGKKFIDAVQSFCLLTKPINVQALRTRTKKSADDYPMQFIFSGSILDKEGKTVAELPNMLSNDPDEEDRALEAHMHRQALYNIQVSAIGVVNPARKQIILEHDVRASLFNEFVNNNPFVPPGREHLFVKGIYEGFIGDFVSSINILVTQFEHSMRFILNNHGVITSGMDDQRRQDDRSLNVTLAVDKLDEIFGEDIAFTLRTLLINRYGPNLRNRIAHGLMDHNSYFSAPAIYLWGILLRLICWPGIVEAYGVNEDSFEEAENPAIGTGQEE